MKAKKRIVLAFILLSIFAVAVTALCGCESIFGKLGNLFSTDINLAFNSELVLDDSYFQYTSQEITPNVTLYHRDEVVAPQYYTLTYTDNVQPGTAKVTATGKDGYYGDVVAEFYISYIYTFDVDGASQVDGEVVQNVFSKSDLQVPEVSKLGYTFSHWSIGSQVVDFEDLDSLPDTAEFVANFTLDVYKIKYVLDGGINSLDNKSTYTVEDTFTLGKPTRSGFRFGGWFLDEEFQHRITSVEGYYEDLTLYAKFGDYSYREICYAVPDGAKEVPSDLLLPETPLSYPEEQTAVIDGRDKVLVWYSDVNGYYKYVFREMPDEDITVYARWEDVVSAGFLDKIEQFSGSDVDLYSYRDLVDFIDYVCFNNVVLRKNGRGESDWDDPKIPRAYLCYESDVSLDNQIKQALNVDCTYPRMTTATYITIDGNSFMLALANDVIGEEASISATGEGDLIPQMGNFFALQSVGRSSDYDKFPIDFVDKTFAVTTSNQLFYVLSRGYRPLPTAGSKAEYIYDYFREVMREICDDSMSDVEKVRAIYEWLILNVQYDYVIVSMNVPNADTYLYDAFYLEGVLNGVSVCDGLSKAFCVMCAIERIDCLRVTGDVINKDSDGNYFTVGHAWNKVQIFGEWFVTDVTWGNADAVNEASEHYEFISYQYLLFTDADRPEIINQSFTDYVADTKFDLGLYFSYRDLQVGNYTADFYVDSVEELSYILEYAVISYDSNLIGSTSFSIVIDVDLVASNASINAIVSNAIKLVRDRNRNISILSYYITITIDVTEIIFIPVFV